MYVIPRSNLFILNERQELQTHAFYILLGEDEATKPKADMNNDGVIDSANIVAVIKAMK